MSHFEWNDWCSLVFIALGCFFALTGAIGIIRMPDFYTRLHPAGKTDTLGQFLILGGLAFQLIESDLHWSDDYTSDPWMCLVRIVLIIIVILVTAPTATHAITKAALLDGLEPWTKAAEAISHSEVAVEDSKEHVDDHRGNLHD